MWLGYLGTYLAVSAKLELGQRGKTIKAIANSTVLGNRHLPWLRTCVRTKAKLKEQPWLNPMPSSEVKAAVRERLRLTAGPEKNVDGLA
jgi:hypothetical protein